MDITTDVIDLTEQFYFHRHKLILNEDYHSREGDLCYACGLILHSPSDVYCCIYSSSAEEDDCAHFFLHKSCAHLPDRIPHPSHEHSMERAIGTFEEDSCSICGNNLKGLYYICYECETYKLCLICVVPLNKFNIYPAYHRHKLTLSTRLATFHCDACHTVDVDFSYMCYTCPFWIHLSCSNLPNLLECESHRKHPLRLAYSLPEMYRKFPQTCKICTQPVYESHWLYYCPNCRFFAHVKCATPPPSSRLDFLIYAFI